MNLKSKYNRKRLLKQYYEIVTKSFTKRNKCDILDSVRK